MAIAQGQQKQSKFESKDQGKGASKPEQDAAHKDKTPKDETPDDAIALLTADHRAVEKLFADFESASQKEKKAVLARQICRELIVHTSIEEEIFYPACRAKLPEDLMDEAQVEHDTVKTLIAELLVGSAHDRYYDAKVKVLSEYVKHHVKEEEAGAESMFAKAKAAGLNAAELAKRLKTRKAELKASADQRLEAPRTRSFISAAQHNTQGEGNMARQYYPQGHDTDDDREYYDRGNRSSSRWRTQDDDHDYDRSMRPITAQSSDRDDNNRSQGRGNGGRWYGDIEGDYERNARNRGYNDEHNMRGTYESDEYQRGRQGANRQGGNPQGGNGGEWYGGTEGRYGGGREWNQSSQGQYGQQNQYGRQNQYDSGQQSRYGSQGQWQGSQGQYGHQGQYGSQHDPQDRYGSRSMSNDYDEDFRRQGRGRWEGSEYEPGPRQYNRNDDEDNRVRQGRGREYGPDQMSGGQMSGGQMSSGQMRSGQTSQPRRPESRTAQQHGNPQRNDMQKRHDNEQPQRWSDWNNQ